MFLVQHCTLALVVFGCLNYVVYLLQSSVHKTTTLLFDKTVLANATAIMFIYTLHLYTVQMSENIDILVKLLCVCHFYNMRLPYLFYICKGPLFSWKFVLNINFYIRVSISHLLTSTQLAELLNARTVLA